MLTYFSAFEVFFEENLPKLFAHFKKNNLSPDIYLIDWWVSPPRVVRCFFSLALLMSCAQRAFCPPPDRPSLAGKVCWPRTVLLARPKVFFKSYFYQCNRLLQIYMHYCTLFFFFFSDPEQSFKPQLAGLEIFGQTWLFASLVALLSPVRRCFFFNLSLEVPQKVSAQLSQHQPLLWFSVSICEIRPSSILRSPTNWFLLFHEINSHLGFSSRNFLNVISQPLQRREENNSFIFFSLVTLLSSGSSQSSTSCQTAPQLSFLLPRFTKASLFTHSYVHSHANKWLLPFEAISG